ncbi:MAG: TRAP-type C4-dicarboxylate transport system, small permease component [candidate division NC10 bacterium]|jgi:TRAP-type C4-dicarboxylate transport system permease small subunit|nr:TRAP-type C4-dicarboxylate transport system, small permease component [candidate division NC10 bacterium]MBS1116191.1 TRAP-type C4-dicarboxylate transport system, small permease component [candidate division NC10 bacterium]
MRDGLAMLRRVLEGTVRWIVIVLMGVMTILVSVQIVSRYVFNFPLGWTEEMARFAFVWVSFLGASALMQVREHINVTVFVDTFPARLYALCRFLADCCGLICIYFFLIGGIALTSNEWRQLAPATEVPMGWIYLVIPAAAALMGTWVLLQTIESARALIKGK